MAQLSKSDLITQIKVHFKALRTFSGHLTSATQEATFLLDDGFTTGRQVHWAIDFHIVYDYLRPHLDQIKNPSQVTEQRDSSQWLVANTILSGIFIKNCLLLPPYKVELDDLFTFMQSRTDQAYTRLTQSLESRIIKIDASLRELQPILYKFRNDIFLTNGDYQFLSDFIRSNYHDLFTLLSMSVVDFKRQLESLFGESITLFRADDFHLSTSFEQIIRRAEDHYFGILNEERPKISKRYANFLDAIALELISDINTNFRVNHRNEVLFFLTSSSSMHRAYSRYHQQLISQSLAGMDHLHLKRPEPFWALLLFAPTLSDISSVKSALGEASVKIKKMQSACINLIKICKKSRKDSDFEYVSDQLSLLESDLRAMLNLDMASKELTFQERIQERFFAAGQHSLSEAQRESKEWLDSFLRIMTEDNVIKSLKAMSDSMYKRFTNRMYLVETLAFIKLITFIRSKSPDFGYMLSFDDPVVNALYQSIIYGTKVKSAVDELFSIRKDVSIKGHIEVYLLMAYLYDKAKKVKCAHDELDRMSFEVTDVKLNQKITFMRNMVLASGNRIQEAILGCRDLIELSPENPRYYIQLGYYLWNLAKQNKGQEADLLEQAIESMEHARRLSSSCSKPLLRVIYHDLTIFYAEAAKIREAENAYLQLDLLKTEDSSGCLYDFAKAVLLFRKFQYDPRHSEKSLLKEAKLAISRAYEHNPDDYFYRHFYDQITDAYKTSDAR